MMIDGVWLDSIGISARFSVLVQLKNKTITSIVNKGNHILSEAKWEGLELNFLFGFYWFQIQK